MVALTSRVPGTIDALVSTFGEAGLKTWDGPVVTGDYDNAVFVGYNGDPDGEEFVAVADHMQTWAGLGQRARNETFSVVCAIVALQGDGTTSKSARDTAYQMLDQVGESLRATQDSPALGQPSPFVASLRPNATYVEPGPAGWQVRIPFFVDITIARV